MLKNSQKTHKKLTKNSPAAFLQASPGHCVYMLTDKVVGYIERQGFGGCMMLAEIRYLKMGHLVAILLQVTIVFRGINDLWSDFRKKRRFGKDIWQIMLNFAGQNQKKVR